MSNLLSVVIIAKNEEQFIQDAIKSAQFADEVLLLDSGSIDKTCEISKKMGLKFFIDFEVIKSDFRGQKNLRFFEISEISGLSFLKFLKIPALRNCFKQSKTKFKVIKGDFSRAFFF